MLENEACEDIGVRHELHELHELNELHELHGLQGLHELQELQELHKVHKVKVKVEEFEKEKTQNGDGCSISMRDLNHELKQKQKVFIRNFIFIILFLI